MLFKEGRVDEVIADNARLVEHAAKWHSRGRERHRDDLVQCGYEGLVLAASKFDPDSGFRFSTYALHWVNRAIVEHLRRSRRFVVAPRSETVRRGTAAMSTGEIRSPEELSKVSGVSMYISVPVFLLYSSTEVGLEKRGSDGDEYEWLQSESNPEREVSALEVARAIRIAVDSSAKLSEQERYLVERRFFSGEDVQFTEIARELGLTKQRIEQIRDQAMLKLGRVLRNVA